MKLFFLITASLLTLSACASVMDSQMQMITMRTPGVSNAKCVIQNESMKYIAYTDQTIEIMKSPHDLVVNCQADGNREKTVHVKREVNDWVFLNVTNGFVPGATYDYFSRGAFDYPEVFTVSFSGEPVKAYSKPEYSGAGQIERMGSDVKDGGVSLEKPSTLQKKENLYQHNIFGSSVSGRATDSIHRQYNPNVSSYDPREEDK